MDVSLSELQEMVMDREAFVSMRSQRVGHDWATELNWTELKVILLCLKMLKKNSASQLLSSDSITCIFL